MAIQVRPFAYENPMRRPRLVKVVVNVGVGEGGEKLLKAEKVLGMVTGRKPVRTLARVANREFGIKPGAPIGCKVTLRGEDAAKFLRKALGIRSNRIPWYSFDEAGNLNFGIADYTDFEGMRYDPEIGIYGMNITAVLARPGLRVQERRLRRARIDPRQRVTREEAIAWFAKEFGVEAVE